jgi:hypothetical protein
LGAGDLCLGLSLYVMYEPPMLTKVDSLPFCQTAGNLSFSDWGDRYLSTGRKLPP